MFILSNSIGIYGATTMLYPDIIKEIADTMEADIYILPSSLHEVILVLDYGLNYNENKLKEMVHDINRTIVNEDEVLSDSVYKYCRDTKKIEKL